MGKGEAWFRLPDWLASADAYRSLLGSLLGIGAGLLLTTPAFCSSE